ncbi:MAG TPA: DUF937 domain-containing protein [Chloroflexota bacterium]|nr:DUF937 domain-containing protein [Chloroflexota bacterium]
MPGMLDSLSQMVTPEMAGQAARMLGVDEQTVQQGMATAGPLLQQLLADRASTPEGARQVYDTVTGTEATEATGATGGLTGMLGSLAGAAVPAAGAGGGQGLVDQLLGPQARQAVTELVRKQTGTDIGPLLALAAPLLAGALGKLVRERNLDASGLAGLLQTESREYAAQHPEMQSLLAGAVEASHRASGTAPEAKAAPAAAAAAPAENAPPPPGGALSADELASLADAPARAGGLVMTASPSGGAGAAQEIAAFAAAVSEAATAAAPGSLLGQLADPLHVLARQVQTTGLPVGGGAGALETLQSAAALVDARASAEDAAAYKAMLLDVAERVARAAKEGSFLGIGGQQVSAAETEAIETIRTALEGGTPAGGAPAGIR